MSTALPKVKRVDGALPVGVWLALGATIVLLVIIIALMLNGTLFSSAPKSDLERDYAILLEGVKKSPENPAVLMTLAEVEFELGKEADAWTHSEAALRYAKKAPGFQLRYAQLKLKDGDTATASTALDREIKIDGTSSGEPYFLLAQVQAEGKQYDKAIASMKKGLGITPQAADMMVVYGRILEDAGRKDAAVAQYTKALRFLPDDPDATAALKRLGEKIPAKAESPHGN